METANFINDEEKMRDFLTLSKYEFLRSYSYLTEEEYDNTEQLWKKKFLDGKIKSIEEEYKIPEGYIEVYCDDNGHYGIMIAGKDWSNYLSVEETYQELLTLERGIAIGREIPYETN